MKRTLLAVLVLAGCTNTHWMPADIDQAQTLETLGSAGYARLCDAFEGYIRDEYQSSYIIQAVCLADGIANTTTASACGDHTQACTETLPPSAEALLQQILAQASCTAIGVNPTGCAATVAQVKACLDGLESELGALQFTLTCAVAGEPFDQGWWHIDLPVACTTLRTLCPP